MSEREIPPQNDFIQKNTHKIALVAMPGPYHLDGSKSAERLIGNTLSCSTCFYCSSAPGKAF